MGEFAAVTGLHRKHAVRLLRGGAPSRKSGSRPGRRVYDVAVREALIVIWEASDRVCGKRLHPLVPLLIDAMERHGHLHLASDVRGGLLAMSAARIDRALREVREQAGGRTRRRAAPSAGVRRSVPVRTWLLSGSGVVAGTSRDQGCDERAEKGFAASSRVVHELQEAEIERQLVLRDVAVRSQPGAQQGPKTLDRVDEDLAKAVAILITGVFAAPVADVLCW